MQFKWMGAFHNLDGDEDNLGKLLRVLTAVHWTALTGASWLMLGSAWMVGYEGRSYEHGLVGVLVYSTVLFVFYCSHAFFYSYYPRRHFLGPSLLAAVLVAGETATSIGSWDLDEVLVWWRMALLVVVVSWFLLWAGVRAAQLRQSKQKDLRSST